MTKRMILPLIFGLGGIAVLLWLAFWQMDRLQWKRGLIESIETQLVSEPQELITQYKRTDSVNDRNYIRVKFEGVVTNKEAHVYAPDKKQGLGYRVVSEFLWNDTNLFLDLGYVPDDQKDAVRPSGAIRGTGHVLTPQDYDPSFTPDPDVEKNIYFSRFITPMAMNLGVTPFMVVVEQAEIQVDGVWQNYEATTLKPVEANFKNDHREYAITWFALALVWFGMTLYLLWRIRQKTV